MERGDDTIRWFDALFGALPEDQHILIWTSADKASRWFTELAQAAQYASFRQEDVFAGMALRSNPPASGRGLASEVDGICALWADLDIGERGHKCFSSPNELHAFLASLPLHPSLIVDSGGGRHAYWLFKEPWIFDSDEERRRAAALSRVWISTLRFKAQEEYGAWIDSVHDLSRVMRVPGTKNSKRDSMCAILFWDEALCYDPTEIEELLIDSPFWQSEKYSSEMISVEPLVLNPNAEPNETKLDLLLRVDPRIRATWEHSREILPDASQSGYDMSLATYAVQYGWLDQEVADLLIAYRRQHGGLEKGLRQDYIERTIAAAKRTVASWKATPMEIPPSFEGIMPDSDEEREEALAGLSDRFGFHVQGIWRYNTRPKGRYRMLAEGIDVPIGEMANILVFSRFRQVCLDWVKRLIPHHTKEQWEVITLQIRAICVEVDLGSEVSRKGEAEDLVGAYLERNPPAVSSEDERVDRIERRLPFIDSKGRTCLSLQTLREWLMVHMGEKRSRTEIAELLRDAGWEFGNENILVNGGRTSRGVWRKDRMGML